MNALEIVDLKKLYASGTGVQDVTMTVKSGTMHGFLGVNGAGKTTTMKCVVSLIKKDSGSISVFGEEIKYEDPKPKLKIGFSPELPAFPPYLTGMEILTVYGRMRGLPRRTLEDEANNILKTLDLYDARNRRVGKYSRGMLARLGVGTAMLGDPELLILDEPTSGLDPVGAEELRSVLRDIVKQGRTILLSSHLLNEVQKDCSVLTVIDKGKVIAEGSTNDLLRNYQSSTTTYTAEFSRLDDSIIKALSRLKKVMSVKLSEKNERTVTLTVEDSRDIRPEIATVGQKHKSMLLTCNKDKTDLEQVFLSMVGFKKTDAEEDKNSRP